MPPAASSIRNIGSVRTPSAMRSVDLGSLPGNALGPVSASRRAASSWERLSIEVWNGTRYCCGQPSGLSPEASGQRLTSAGGVPSSAVRPLATMLMAQNTKKENV